MKNPDRFARAVGQHRHIACDGMGYILLEETAKHLLRLEHRAVVRLVTRMSKGQGATKCAPRETEEWMSSESWINGYFQACNDLLAALARRKR